MTYAHRASISSGSSRSSHGGILRFPLVTESTKRVWALRGKSRRLIAHCGLRICVPWQVAQWRANSAAPFLICSGANCGSPSCAAALAHTNARPRLAAEKTFMCSCDPPLVHRLKGKAAAISSDRFPSQRIEKGLEQRARKDSDRRPLSFRNDQREPVALALLQNIWSKAG